MGRDLQAELALADGQVVMAQIPRDQINYASLHVGRRLHIRSREARSFVHDYSI
jgi:sulfate transport system ATP-binding protein